MQKNPFVSVIVPCREIDLYTKECISYCMDIEYPNFDIIVLPDKKSTVSYKDKRVKIVPSGPVKPGIKRNLGMKKSRAGIYAFIDSDAYPERRWLRNAVGYFENEKIGLVGGPNLTPPKDNFRQKISGILLSKWIVGGRTAIRYKVDKEQKTVELPSCNFIVRKELATNFQTDLLTAEDSKFCFNITKKGKIILYAPDVVVYHHRREVFMPHARQMWIYGRDIALLLKRKGQFSLDKVYYSLLSLFVSGVIAGFILSFINQTIRLIYFLSMLFYLAVVLISSLSKNLKEVPYLLSGIILTHFSYGFGFLYGLFIKTTKHLNLR